MNSTTATSGRSAAALLCALLSSSCVDGLDDPSPTDGNRAHGSLGVDECVPESELCDGVDNDCDGVVDERITNCSTAEVPGPPPADDEAPPEVPADFPEHPSSRVPPLDRWPAGCVDGDRDGVPTCSESVSFPTDCDDEDSEIGPGASELCDGIDQDCDGVIDERITSCPTAEIPGPPPARR